MSRSLLSDSESLKREYPVGLHNSEVEWMASRGVVQRDSLEGGLMNNTSVSFCVNARRGGDLIS